MQYMGSKNRFSKELVPIIQSYITEDTIGYIEPFVGGANVINKIDCKKKIGCDVHNELIELLNHIKKTTDDLPKTILFDEYDKVRASYKKKDNSFESWYYGLVGFCGSFGNRFFDGGYARNSKEDVNGERVSNSIKNIVNQAPTLKNIDFKCIDFRDLNKKEIKGYVIYCDPPYRNTKQYSTGIFPYEEYYEWCREMSVNNIILCSEYEMPNDFECIWEKESKALLDSNKKENDNKNKRIERLFIYKG